MIDGPITKVFTKEIREYLAKLGLLNKKDNVGTDITKPNPSEKHLSEELVGEWYYYTQLSGYDVGWEIRFNEHGEVIIAVGYLYSEYSYWKKGIWSVTNKSGEYILTVNIPEGYKCDCIVTLDGNRIKLEKKSGDDDIAIKYGQWYERDKKH